MIVTCKIKRATAVVAFFLTLMVRCFEATPPADWKSYLNNVTPYRVVANTDASPPKFNGCRPTHFWGLLRHGTRNPNEKFFRLGREVLLPLRDQILANKKGSLSASEISRFTSWGLGIEEKDILMLTKEGAREIRQLGERFRRRFPELLGMQHDGSTFEVYHTSAVRTKDSASNFTVGVFGEGSQSKIVFADKEKSDSILKFYRKCDKYIAEVKNSKDLKTETGLFVQGEEVEKMAKAVSNRLGMSKTLDVDDIIVIYTWCGFGSAWSDEKLSPWCSAFSKEDLQVLEYIRDIKHFSKHGYWAKITGEMMCPMVKNVFDFFSSASTKPLVKINFAHSNTILKFYTSIGLFRDPCSLKASNFAGNLKRLWRGSFIDSFAANIVFVLYDCNGKKEVLTLHNEKPITLPGCPKTGLCPLETILATYSDSINNCNFRLICQNKQ